MSLLEFCKLIFNGFWTFVKQVTLGVWLWCNRLSWFFCAFVWWIIVNACGSFYHFFTVRLFFRVLQTFRLMSNCFSIFCCLSRWLFCIEKYRFTTFNFNGPQLDQGQIASTPVIRLQSPQLFNRIQLSDTLVFKVCLLGAAIQNRLTRFSIVFEVFKAFLISLVVRVVWGFDWDGQVGGVDVLVV